jgi:hypothetical protein
MKLKTFGKSTRTNRQEIEKLKIWQEQLERLNSKENRCITNTTYKSQSTTHTSQTVLDSIFNDKLKIHSVENTSSEPLVEKYDEIWNTNNAHSEPLLESLAKTNELSPEINCTMSTNVFIPNGTFDVLTQKSIQDLLELCNQKRILSFEEYFGRLIPTRKIGEASYSDVYIIDSAMPTAIKIIPIGKKDQCSIHASWLELYSTRHLSECHQRLDSNTSNFVQLLKSGLVSGPYHPELIHLWDHYDEVHSSENVHPLDYKKKQVYLILSMEYCGTDLEHYKLRYNQVYSVLLQIMLTLSQAEMQFGFEHRDLHWGNILLSPFSNSKMDFSLLLPERMATVTIPTAKIKVTLIDFTLSRFCLGILSFNQVHCYCITI